MSERTNNLNDVHVRLRAIGLPPVVVRQLTEEISKRLSDQGAQGTVIWLKSLKVDFVRLLAGQSPVGHYAKRKFRLPSGQILCLPRGVFGYLFRLGAEAGNSRRKLHKVWQALITYTRFESREVTFQQWKKFSSAVRKPMPLKSDLREAEELVSLGLGTLPNPGEYRRKLKPLLTLQAREGKRIPVGRKTRPEKELLGQLRILDMNQFPPLVGERLIKPVVQGTPGALRVREAPSWDVRVRPLHHVGTIGFIQEPGFKLRAVANPNRVLQAALEPLGEYAFSWLRKVPEDCCFSQEAGVYKVQGVLASGLYVHSTDLSNATDLYPYRLVEMVLRHGYVPKPEVRLLKAVSMGTWQVPFGYSVSKKVRTLRWARGCPLGLRPSFAVFSLSHHALVRGACVKLGKVKARRLSSGETTWQGVEFPYRILGDDIVYWDDDVAAYVQRVLIQIGCSISMEKSISSDRVAEFAGRVILPNCILHGMKYTLVSGSQDPADNTFVEHVKNLGPRVIRYLKPHQRAVANFLVSCLPPQGCGWNPRGLPFWERYAMSLAWELSAPVNTPSDAIVQIRQMMRNWYSYKYQDHSATIAWSSPRSKFWDPLSVEQADSRPTHLGIPVEAFAGNVDSIRNSGVEELGLKEELAQELLRSWKLLSGGTPTTDRTYNKSLIESLYPRYKAALEMLPRCRAIVRSFYHTESEG